MIKLEKKAGTDGERQIVTQIIQTVTDALANRKTSEQAMADVIMVDGKPINLALAFKTMIETDINGMNKLNNLVISLLGLSQSPESRMDALRLQLQLKKELARKLNIDLMAEEVDILTLVRKAKDSMSYSSIRDLIDATKNSIAQSKLVLSLIHI